MKAEEDNKMGSPGDAAKVVEDGVCTPEETDSSSQSGKSSDAGAESSKDEQAKTDDSKPVEINWKDTYLRLRADFDNYKKRAARDREDTYRYAEADILGDVLPAVDNLALALANAKDKDDPFVKGVSLVYDSLLASLKNHGAEPFDSVGYELDTEKMEAIATLPSEEIEEGKVSNEVKKGWLLKGKVLRAAQVVVSAGSKKENG